MRLSACLLRCQEQAQTRTLQLLELVELLDTDGITTQMKSRDWLLCQTLRSDAYCWCCKVLLDLKQVTVAVFMRVVVCSIGPVVWSGQFAWIEPLVAFQLFPRTVNHYQFNHTYSLMLQLHNSMLLTLLACRYGALYSCTEESQHCWLHIQWSMTPWACICLRYTAQYDLQPSCNVPTWHNIGIHRCV